MVIVVAPWTVNWLPSCRGGLSGSSATTLANRGSRWHMIRSVVMRSDTCKQGLCLKKAGLPWYLFCELPEQVLRHACCFRRCAHNFRIESCSWSEDHGNVCDKCDCGFDVQEEKHALLCCSVARRATLGASTQDCLDLVASTGWGQSINVVPYLLGYHVTLGADMQCFLQHSSYCFLNFVSELR